MDNSGKLRHLCVGMLVISGIIELAGCSRHHYRLRADNDAYDRVLEKSANKPWMPPSDFSAYPAPHSRLFDPTPIEDPCLPSPAPQLYDYQLPALAERDASRFKPKRDLPSDFDGEFYEEIDAPRVPPVPSKPDDATDGVEPQSPPTPTPFHAVAFRQPNGEIEPDGTGADVARDDEAVDLSEEDSVQPTQAKQVPLPEAYWNSIPADCLSRMFEFESVRKEYAATFGSPPDESQQDDSPRLALEDIIELTLLNSRELQTQKENLYRVALALTLERFDYQLKPSVGNNGTSTDYTHNRSGGITTDNLRIPTTFQLEKMLYTGGDILGRFANDVLLTFNGPQGFAVDVGSELLFNFSQSLLQRDVRLENLTQAERSVVYAARDFTRFRKELFVQQATDYYSLILQFRQIEINCQNYFTLAREFNQRSVEIEFGMAARTQLDQVEQQVINGRQSVLSTCTSLENSLDSLKIRMGIPTEQPLNLDLSELNLLTLRDELAVNAELINRTSGRITKEMRSDTRSAFVILGGVGQLAEQMLDSIRLRDALGEGAPELSPLENRLIELRIEAADIDVEDARRILTLELNEASPDSTKLIQRRRDVVVELLNKVDWQIRLLLRTSDDLDEVDEISPQYRRFRERLNQLQEDFIKIIDSDQTDEFDETMEALLVQQAADLRVGLDKLTDELDRAIGRPDKANRPSFEERASTFANELLGQGAEFRAAAGGLVPLEIDMDDAMLTALVQRFDLMNERGALADDWRQIKFAADDLKSVLNLRASQSIRTRNGVNEPFDFRFDDSTTSVGMSLDLPFNRRAQRNRFRTSLFDYQVALRRVTRLEDDIKLSVRRNLRTLTLDRQQYANDIAGAALAFERVTGTELEVRGGFATSRDFLESQTAYVAAVSNVASRHINYIVGRLQLFLELESLTVGDNGFWDELYDEEHQPQPYYQLPGYAQPAYGELHPKLKYSPMIRRMEYVPNGTSMVQRPPNQRPPNQRPPN